MKMRKFALAFLLTMFVMPVFAQETPAVTDEELKKYAVAMDSIEVLKGNVIKIITELVDKNEKIAPTRYNELSRIIADEAKLTEAKATPEEIAVVKEIIARRDEETKKINTTLQSLAKDYVGAATFNKVRNAVKADAALKARYDELMKELAKDNS
jgi:hypothetical protein